MDLYIQKILRVSVAQICQTIGYNSIQSIPLELLIDSLHKFLQEFARDLHRHVELFNRTEANLDDVALSLQSLNISVDDIFEYINHVQPVACSIEIPKLPSTKLSNLNFLKPGSKEVLTRPVHIYEYLPPMLRDVADIGDKSNIAIISSSPNSISNANNTKINNENVEDINPQQHNELNEVCPNGIKAVENNNSAHQSFDVKRKPILDSSVSLPSSATREMSSVMMTSGGFISPAIEGRMPECLIPDIVEKYSGLDAPPSVTPPVLVASQALVPSDKMGPASPIPNSAYSSLRSLIKTEDQNVSSSELKISQTTEKKHLKKVKKKSMSAMLLPNMTGVIPPVLTDKAQRKRIKMLQKSMTKPSANSTNNAHKSKNSNINTSGSQEKYLKKQVKLKKKQIRQLYVQKQMEAALSATPNLMSNGRGHHAHSITQSDEFGKIGKPKKDYFIVPPAPLSEQLPGSTASKLLLPSLQIPSSKTVNHNPSGTQDKKITSSIAPVSHLKLSPKCDEVKLNNEPDRSKLNIFKKISSTGRKERTDVAVATSTHLIASIPIVQLPSTTDVATPSSSSIFGDDQVISLPSGTTITPAPPSGSGRHVYAPPPSAQSADFDSLISVDDSSSIPEGSAVLMQRGDLLIHKPKKRGRKPGSKNQPKILGLNSKKTKKIKKSLFSNHSNSNVGEPLNLSHSSIANIANIPLGIASTFPIDSEAVTKMKKDRKKAKMVKDTNFIRNTCKSPSSRNLAPTTEEFATINQKLMRMDTVLETAPPLPPNKHSPLTSRVGSLNTSSLGVASSFPLEQDPIKGKKERKKSKQNKEQKHLMLQGAQPLSTTVQSSKSSNTGIGQKSPLPYPHPNFPNVLPGLPMFPYYPFPARPGLIPSHNLFSQLPNMQNNAFFMPPLMGFRPLNPPVRPSLKDEKEDLTPPLLHVGEGNYSKVAPLVPDTIKLELVAASRSITSSPGMPGTRFKASSMSSASSSLQTFDTSTGLSAALISGNNPHFGDFRKRIEEHNSLGNVSTSGSSLNIIKNFEGPIEVSSDDSVPNDMVNQVSLLAQRTPLASTTISSTTAIHIHSQATHSFAIKDELNSIENSDNSPTERRKKENKKFKKLGKPAKKQLTLSTTSEFKNSRQEPETFGNNSLKGEVSSMQINAASELCNKNEESANSSGHTVFDYGISPERRKDHKKIKKLLKESKLKKKKDKKDKNKNKDRNDKLMKSEKSEKRKDEKKDKDKLKKMKKEKRKENQRTDMDATTLIYSSPTDGTSPSRLSSIVPKLTLKLGQSSQSPTPLETSEVRKVALKSFSPGGAAISIGRESSPELARISPLVTRPPKQKFGLDDNTTCSSLGNASSSSGGNLPVTGQTSSAQHQTTTLSANLNIPVDSVIDIDSNSEGPTTSMLPASATILEIGINTSTNNSPCNNAIAASSPTPNTLNTVTQAGGTQTQQLPLNKQSTAVLLISETNRPSSYINTSTKDAEGNRVWICPACGKVDDGSAMIGCDGCDAWYHWVCVGIFVAPNDNEDWYCRVCIAKKRGMHGVDRKRKRNKKKNINS